MAAAPRITPEILKEQGSRRDRHANLLQTLSNKAHRDSRKDIGSGEDDRLPAPPGDVPDRPFRDPALPVDKQHMVVTRLK